MPARVSTLNLSHTHKRRNTCSKHHCNDTSPGSHHGICLPLPRGRVLLAVAGLLGGGVPGRGRETDGKTSDSKCQKALNRPV